MPPSRTVHAIDYLESPETYPAGPVCVVFGDESFLKRQSLARLRREVLGGDEGDFSLTTFEGPTATLRDVMGELATVAMFGKGKRLVVVEDADELVSRHRPEFEDYVARPKPTGVLVLEVATWPSNTRLYKAVAAAGLQIECTAPASAPLARWVVAWAKRMHAVQLPGAAADMLVELVGPDLGLMDQELAKLAVAAGSGEKVSAEMVGQLVGSWRTRTAWDMLDAALEGNVAQALIQLERLLLAGESPVAILGQVSASLRRFAAATKLVLEGEVAGRRVALREALEQAGAKRFVLDKSERQLRRLGRHRGEQLYRWLLDADLDLKGASTLAPRTILERLLVRIASPPIGRPSGLGR